MSVKRGRLDALLDVELVLDAASEPPGEPPAPTRAWPRRIAIGVAAVTLIAIAVAVITRAPEPRAARWQPKIVDLPVHEHEGDGAVISPDGTQLAFASALEHTGRFRAYVMPLPGGPARAVTPPAGSFEHPRWTRDGRALLLMRREQGSDALRIVRQPIDGGAFVDLGPGANADDCGDAVAITEADRMGSRLMLRRADGTRTLLATSTVVLSLPRCDPGGRRIVFVRGPSLSVADPSNDLYVIDRAGREIRLAAGHASHGAFTPDGRSVVFSSRHGGEVQLAEVSATGGPIHPLTFATGPDALPSILPDVSPDGRTVVFDRHAASTTVYVGDGASIRTLATVQDVVFAVLPTRDGTALIAARMQARPNEIVVISTRDGSERALALGQRPFPSHDGRRVLFRAIDGNRLQSIPIEGGPITTIATLPGDLLSGADGPDGPHLELEREGRSEAWHVTAAGHVESEGMAGLVLPAPSGGWRAVRTVTHEYQFRFIAPDGSSPPHEVGASVGRPTWLDAHRFAYVTRGELHVLDVTTGVEGPARSGLASSKAVVLGADGVHWYGVWQDTEVTRHVLVNFADRPWK